MRQTGLAALLTASILVAAPAPAQAPEAPAPGTPERATPREMLEEGARTILKAFELMIQAIPQYQAPEVLENGDIIIRRKQPLPPAPKPTPGDGAPKTRT